MNLLFTSFRSFGNGPAEAGGRIPQGMQLGIAASPALLRATGGAQALEGLGTETER